MGHPVRHLMEPVPVRGRPIAPVDRGMGLAVRWPLRGYTIMDITTHITTRVTTITM